MFFLPSPSVSPTLSLSLSIEEPMLLGAEDDREERPALVPSLFPLIPPTLYFSTANEKGQDREDRGQAQRVNLPVFS